MRLTPITSFRGPYFFLSNFYPSPVSLEGIDYPTAEHAYQASKSALKEAREKIAECATPAEAKALGRHIHLRKDWSETAALQAMKEVLLTKFKQNPVIGQRLLCTSPSRLIERNTWGDTFWGEYQGRGDNHLGKLLMEVRSEIRSITQV